MTDYVHVRWVRLKSWHLMSSYGPERTYCGRTGPFNATRDALPMDEKSCESCLRVQAHRGE